MATFEEIINRVIERNPQPAPVVVDDKPAEYLCKCYSAKVAMQGDLCPRCTKEKMQGYEMMALTGRCRSGGDWGGTLYHAVRFGEYAAVCGAKPGRRSVGWSDYHGDDVTCPRCLKKLAKTQPDQPVIDALHQLAAVDADYPPALLEARRATVVAEIQKRNAEIEPEPEKSDAG